MTQFLLNAAETVAHDVGNTLAERTAYSLSHTLVGMLIIFAVLAAIWAVLAVFKLIFAGRSEKKTVAPAQSTPAPANAATPAVSAVAAPKAAQAAPASSDGEIVAAITAAITLMREAEGTTGTFRVVSFRRTGGARPWNQG